MQDSYDIESIKSGLAECRAMMDSGVLQPLADIIDDSVVRLDEPMQLAIIGKISSSKSTLVNAILGKDGLMSTGQKEVTYNVGWLKYGNPESDIVIHYKDGTTVSKNRKEFESYSADTTNSEIDRISYIETFDDAEILKNINIIDTPGLDAKREKDSQNTLDFIANVHPDAVVMLFTHAVSESVLDVVRQFNAGADFNPLNAIGVLSKIDVLWQETIPRTKSALEIGRKMVDNRKRKDAMLSKTLFDLYPVSALLYLASTTVTDKDVEDIKHAYEFDPEAFSRSLNSMSRFLEEPKNPLSREERKRLADRLGLYGIWIVVQCIDKEEPTDIDALKKKFFVESGAQNFRKTLYNHFGTRAKLIKIEGVFQRVTQELSRLKAKLTSTSDRALLSAIEQRLCDVFSSLVHEHREYNLLNRIYSGELVLDDNVCNEIRNICGENGNSAPEKLGLPAGTDYSVLLDKALCKVKEWRREVALEPDPDEREWMNVLLKSYTLLRCKIALMIYQYEQAATFLYNK